MNAEQARIWNYLVQNALGRANAKHIETIAQNIGVPARGSNNDDVRGWITDLVITHGKQIGTCPQGAFIILNDFEREEAARFLERNTRANAVRRNGNYSP